VFVGPKGGVIRRSTFEPRFWRPACDGRPAKPTTRGRRALEPWAPLAPGLEAGRGLRHSHKKMLQDEDIPDFAIEARLGHSKKGISGVYSHVSAEMEARIVAAVERRWTRALHAEAERQAAGPPLPANGKPALIVSNR
jgi:integrase